MADISNKQINITQDVSNNVIQDVSNNRIDISSNTPKFFATLTTPELMKKQQEEVTRIELEALMTQIKNNPKLLKPKQIHNMIESESDSDDSTYSSSSSDSSSDSSSSSSSDSSRKHANKKHYRSNNLEIYKKGEKIDELEKKLYYKTLRLSNITLENSKLTSENELLKNKSKDNELLFSIILSIIDYSSNELFKKVENITNDNIFIKKVSIEEEFENNKKKLQLINNKLNDIPNIKIRKFFQDEILKINYKMVKKYEVNYKLIDDYMSGIKCNERIYNIIFMFLGGILLLIAKELFY
jgi:hypothetical protein